MEDFCDKLRERHIEASLDAAKGTAELLRQLVTSQRLPDPQSLLAEVKSVGLRIQAAKPIGAVPWPGAGTCTYYPPRRHVLPRLAHLASQPAQVYPVLAPHCRACDRQHCAAGDAHHP